MNHDWTPKRYWVLTDMESFLRRLTFTNRVAPFLLSLAGKGHLNFPAVNNYAVEIIAYVNFSAGNLSAH